MTATDVADGLGGGLKCWDPARYAQNARFVPELGRIALNWLQPQPGEDILDLGCGDGVLTREIMQSGARVVGIDASPDMTNAARRDGVDAHVMDARTIEFSKCFDAVFSNAVLHWIPEPEQVIRRVAAALRPGGRFVGEFGGKGNVAAIVAALSALSQRHGLEEDGMGIWFNPGAEEYRSMLEDGGFTVRRIELVPRQTPVPAGIEEWLMTFRAEFFRDRPGLPGRELLTQAASLLAPAMLNDHGEWIVDYVRLRFAADVP